MAKEKKGFKAEVEIAEEKGLYLRVHLASGTIEDNEFAISVNADGLALFFEFTGKGGKHTIYKMPIKHLLEETYRHHFEGK